MADKVNIVEHNVSEDAQTFPSGTLVSSSAVLPKSVLGRYLDLPLPTNAVVVTYVWIHEEGGELRGGELRCKNRTFNFVPKYPEDLPLWNCGSTVGPHTEVTLRPRRLYCDPFYREPHLLALCDTYMPKDKPTAKNCRFKCQEAYDKCKDHEPLFSIEQEYLLLDSEFRPFGWSPSGPPPEGPYYCGVGTNRVFARDLVEAHIRCCQYAGVSLEASWAGAVAAQWHFVVGGEGGGIRGGGLSTGDDVWVARYMLQRLAELFGVIVSFSPDTERGWRGAALHTSFSTKYMRGDNGMIEIENAVNKLSKAHLKHMRLYRPGNIQLQRLHDAPALSDFSVGVEESSSICIPSLVAEEKRGYLEDRRPASNCDPYAVLDALMRTCILNEH